MTELSPRNMSISQASQRRQCAPNSDIQSAFLTDQKRTLEAMVWLNTPQALRKKLCFGSGLNWKHCGKRNDIRFQKPSQSKLE